MTAVSLALVKDFLTTNGGVPTFDPAREDELLDTVERAEAILARRIGPLVPITVMGETHGGAGPLLLRRRPVLSVESVTDNGVAVADYEAVTGAGMIRVPYSWTSSRFVVSYTVGYGTPLPLDLEAAVLELVAHLWRSQRVPGATRAATFGQQSEQDMQVGQGFLLPYRVQTLIEPHMLPSIA